VYAPIIAAAMNADFFNIAFSPNATLLRRLVVGQKDCAKRFQQKLGQVEYY
jgi:hypothetical protein